MKLYNVTHVNLDDYALMWDICVAESKEEAISETKKDYGSFFGDENDLETSTSEWTAYELDEVGGWNITLTKKTSGICPECGYDFDHNPEDEHNCIE